MIKIIPLGAACRSAYHVSRILGGDRFSYPFDWTVTSYESLEIVLNNKFDPGKVLSNENISLREGGGIFCKYSKLTFPHDFPPEELNKFLNGSWSKIALTMPSEFYSSTLVDNARKRFFYTFKRFLEHCKNDDHKIFIRWLGPARNNKVNFPHAGVGRATLEGENFFSLCNILEKFCGKDKFSLFHIYTIYSDSPPKDRILEPYFSYGNYGGGIILLESTPTSFHGDDESWNQLIKFIRSK